MHALTVKTSRKREVVDLTERLEARIPEGGEGVLHLFVLHTTAALTTADLDPGTDLDMLDAFEAMVPKLHYRHPHDPGHVGDHILASLIGTSACVPFKENRLSLGTWQRVVLLEFDGPRERSLYISALREESHTRP
jgi:secondary thiamine-phosphate synthase enzyme